MATPDSLAITQLYVGYFNRAPDPEGLNYWVGRLQAGMTMVEIANSFAVQPESTSTYPWLAAPQLDVGIPEFITQVYQNLFERNPDAAGLAHWTAELLAGKPPGRFILDVISGAQGDDKLVIQHKTEVGNYYTDQALLRGLQWNVADDLAGAADVLDGDRNFWVSNGSVPAGKVNADAIITQQLTPQPGFIEMTTGVDNITVQANETVLGNDLTFNPGDRIVGASGAVDINLGVSNAVFAGVTIDNVDLVNFSAQGNPTVVASLFTNIDEMTVTKSTGGLTLQDLQATSNDAASGTGFTRYGINDYVTDKTLTFNFDIQAANGGNTVVDLDVSEVTGGILMNSGVGGDLETVQMHIEDVAGATSKIASFSAQGIQTLKIDGGTAGLDFQIVGPLDAGLKTINASGAASNLTLDVSKSTQAMHITMGSGNDLLKTGDTLLPIAGLVDTLIGGPGTDTMEAIFTTSGTRQPIMSGFEIANLTFNANAVFNFTDVNDLHTINVASSTNRIALHDMDATVTTINVTGPQAPGDVIGPGGARHDFWYVDGNTLTMNWNAAAEDKNAGELYFRDIKTVTFNHSGPFDTRFLDSIPDGDDSVFQFDDSLLDLTINNKGTGDMYLLGADDDEAIAATRMMRSLSINAIGGDIAVSGDVDTILNLRNLTLSAAGGNYLALDDIGTPDDDINGGTGIGERLEIVNVTTGSNSLISVDDLRADKSSVSAFNVTLGNDSDVTFDDIFAQDISEMTVVGAEESFFDVDDFNFVNQGDNLVVKGALDTGDWDFTDEAFAFMDFSGMTAFGVDVDFNDAEVGSKIITTKFADDIEASQGNDDINSGAGSDDIDGNAGNDIITALGGAGTTTNIRGGLGNDTVNITGAGRDNVIVGHEGPTNFDTINGFNIATDWIFLDLDDMGGDAVNGAGVALTPDADPNLQTVATAGAPGVPNINPASEIFLLEGTFATLGAVETAINYTGSRALIASSLLANPDVGDQLIIGWQDTGGNFHVSAAEITNQVATSLTTEGYNFHLNEMAVVTGVPALATLEFQLVS